MVTFTTEFPAKISLHPSHNCVSKGGRVNLSVIATGDDLTFIWQKKISTSINFTDVVESGVIVYRETEYSGGTSIPRYSYQY